MTCPPARPLTPGSSFGTCTGIVTGVFALAVPLAVTMAVALVVILVVTLAVTLLASAELAAQPTQTQKAYSEVGKRGSARIFYWGGNHSVGQLSIDHGLPNWGERWHKLLLKEGAVRRWRLGKNHWTTLQTNIDLVFLHTCYQSPRKHTAEIRVPAGLYYLTLERNDEDDWILALLDPVKIRAQRLDSYHAHYTKGGILVPMDHRDLVEEAEGARANTAVAGNQAGKTGDGIGTPVKVHNTLDIRLNVSGKNDDRATLWIGFGPNELSVPFRMLPRKGDTVLPDIGAELDKADRFVLENAERFEIFSLDPAVQVPEKERKGDNHLGGYKVIGHKVLEREADRGQVLTLVYQGIVDRPRDAVDCFEPRHGIRARLGKATVALVICYECVSIQVFRNGKQRDREARSGKTVRPAMNKLFRAHGLRIAK